MRLFTSSAIRSPVGLVVIALLAGCQAFDRSPTGTAPPAQFTLLNGAAELGLSAGATIAQSGDVWTLAKTGGLGGTTVTWTITATKTTVANGQLRIDGQLALTNTGDGTATLGNVVVNLQARRNNQWVTLASDVADATSVRGEGLGSATM